MVYGKVQGEVTERIGKEQILAHIPTAVYVIGRCYSGAGLTVHPGKGGNLINGGSPTYTGTHPGLQLELHIHIMCERVLEVAVSLTYVHGVTVVCYHRELLYSRQSV